MSDSSIGFLPADPQIVMIGAGAMGGAMLAGWVDSHEGAAAQLKGSHFIVVEPTEEKAAKLHEELGVQTVANVAEAAAIIKGEKGRPDIVVLAVKPQVMDDVLDQLRWLSWFDSSSQNGHPLVVTIAAGIPTTHFEETLGSDVHIVRVMPNMPLQVGEGATAVSAGKSASADDIALVKALFDCIGSANVVDESQIDVVCALSGGGPAYVAYLIEALTSAGEVHGLDRALAESLAIQTIQGTCVLMDERAMTPEEVRCAVCSPGGTTLAALAAMDEAGFTSSIDAGIAAAIHRARELAG